MSQRIEGEVVDIINEYTVVINVGEEGGVRKGMKFVIYTEAEELLDSKGNSLGKLEIPKAEIEITHVQPKISIGKSGEIYTRTIEPLEHIRYPFGKPETITVRKKLPIEKGDITKREIDMNVRKGDKVRRVE